MGDTSQKAPNVMGVPMKLVSLVTVRIFPMGGDLQTKPVLILLPANIPKLGPHTRQYPKIQHFTPSKDRTARAND